MTDADGTEPKTATDVEIENLKKELNDMKTTYEAKLSEYAEANKGLWAELHKAPTEPEAQTVQEPQGFDVDKAVETFNNCYGIKKVA